MIKTVTVFCNDTNNPIVVLQLNGSVQKTIEVIPSSVLLKFQAGSSSNATASVRIVNKLEEPFTLETPVSDNPAFTAELKPIQLGRESELIVKAVLATSPRNLQGRIVIKTSLAMKPIITINVKGEIEPTVVAKPAQLALPPGPFKAMTTYAISVRNNGKEPVTMSDPTANAVGLSVELKEVEPGRQFTLNLTVPAGFMIPKGTNVEVIIKSSSPEQPVLTVPVWQGARPTATNSPVSIPKSTNGAIVR